jgi:hypothetical protein
MMAGTFMDEVKQMLDVNQQKQLLTYLVEEVIDDEQYEYVVEEVERMTGKLFNDPEVE